MVVRIVGQSTGEKGALGESGEYMLKSTLKHICILESCRGFFLSLWLSSDMAGPTQSQGKNYWKAVRKQFLELTQN